MVDTPDARINEIDPHGDRRIDGWRASAAALDLVADLHVADTKHSDHREVTIRARVA